MPATIMTLSTVRRSLQFAAYPSSSGNLENLIIGHLDTQRELGTLEPRMATLIILISQGYGAAECAREIGVSLSTMTRLLARMRNEFFTDIVIPKMSMEVA